MKWKTMEKITLIIQIVSVVLLTILVILALVDKCTVNNVEPVDPPEENIETVFYYNITKEERYLLAKLVHSEASVYSDECKRAVASVVFNRLDSGKWRKDMNEDGKITLYDIIYYPNAFTPAMNGMIDKWEPTIEDFEAVDYVLLNGPTVPTEVRYFRTDYDFNWEGYENYNFIDNVYFGYFTDWRNGAW